MRYRFGHPVESTLEMLAGKWKPAILDELKERLLHPGDLRKLIARFRGNVRSEAPPSPESADRSAIGSKTWKKARSPGAHRSTRGGHSMQLYVVRHGIAVEGDEGIPDGSRPLTEKGRRRFQKTARAFAKLGHELDLILTSPLVRAVQTAEILAGATDPREVAVLEELDPKFDAAAVRAAIATRAGKARAVAIVGHEPQLSSVLAALSGVPQPDIDLKKGAIVRLDTSMLIDGASVHPRWWLKPKGTRVKGLPLQKQARKSRLAGTAKKTPAMRTAKKRRPKTRKPSEPLKPSPLPVENASP